MKGSQKRSKGQLSIGAFFAPVGAGKKQRGGEVGSISKLSPPQKRQRTDQKDKQSDDVIIIDACTSDFKLPGRDPALHLKAQRKLVENLEKHSWGMGKIELENDQKIAKLKGKSKSKYTPLEQQVIQLKEQHKGVVLIIEVGYKMRFFGEDAEIASKCCNIYCYPDHNFMTASFPVLRLPIYVRRLVENGHRVGVVRQMESAISKSLSDKKYSVFERKLMATYTRATLDAGEQFDVGMDSMNGAYECGRMNHLLCAVENKGEMGVVAVEASTGDVRYGVCRCDALDHEIQSILLRIEPSELIIVSPINKATEKILTTFMATVPGSRTEYLQRSNYEEHRIVENLAGFYGDDDGDKLEQILGLPKLVLCALAGARDYLKGFGLESVLKEASLFTPMASFEQMQLSANALRQLEVLSNNIDGKVNGSLLHLMDNTRTPFGRRLLRRWLSQPLTDFTLIKDRVDAVEEIIEASGKSGVLGQVPELLSKITDLEKGLSRVLHNTASPAEFVALAKGLQLVSERMALPSDTQSTNDCVKSALLVALLRSAGNSEVFSLTREMLVCINIAASEANNLIEMFISKERFPEVIQCKQAVAEAERKLEDLLPVLAKEVKARKLEYVGIQNQGNYLIELPVGHASIPASWEKVCSTKKVDRYHPPSVKSTLQDLELAKDHLKNACTLAWKNFLADFSSHYVTCQSTIQALATLDVLYSFAVLALSNSYCRPVFVAPGAQPCLVAKQARHPILDGLLSGGVVPNDIELKQGGEIAKVVTGPNMGGKSCYIKSAALIVIMAQVGSYVPAASVQLHVFDGIFTRMGASDNIQLGRSTFLEELSDASLILSSATEKSLVIMDELGRGTATHDGVAIAHATLHHLVTQIECLTLFVTHYPEVAKLEDTLAGKVGAYHMAYKKQEASQSSENGGNESGKLDATNESKILFLYKLVGGRADHSFGLNVARMAGLPDSVINCARERAAGVEGNDKSVAGLKDVCRMIRGGDLNQAVKLARDLGGSLGV